MHFAPKQEQFTSFLSKKLKIFKIICIGTSLSIAAGEKKPIKFLKNFEFLWVKTDPFGEFIDYACIIFILKIN